MGFLEKPKAICMLSTWLICLSCWSWLNSSRQTSSHRSYMPHHDGNMQCFQAVLPWTTFTPTVLKPNCPSQWLWERLHNTDSQAAAPQNLNQDVPNNDKIVPLLVNNQSDGESEVTQARKNSVRPGCCNTLTLCLLPQWSLSRSI